MLETVRAYAREKLFAAKEEAARKRALCHWCLLVARRAAGVNPEELTLLVEAEIQNLRAALRWSVREARDAELSLELATVFYPFWANHGPVREGRLWIEESLALSDNVPSELRGRGFHALAHLALAENDFACTIDASERCIEIRSALGDRQGIVAALGFQAVAIGRLGDHDRACAIEESCLALSRELGLKEEADRSLYYLGVTAMQKGDFSRAQAHFAEVLESGQGTRNAHKVAILLHHLGLVASYQHDYARAVAYFEESLSNSSGLGMRRLTADTLCCLGQAAGDLGQTDRAYTFLAEALELHRSIANTKGVVDVAEACAFIDARSGDAARAVALATVATRALAGMNAPRWPAGETETRLRIELAAVRLTQEEYAAAVALGESLTVADAIAIAFPGG
jgi:tetratricopeptide (TPR) repeat protein